MCYLQEPTIKKIIIDPALEPIYDNIPSPETVLTELEIEFSNIELNYSEEFDVSLDDDLILD